MGSKGLTEEEQEFVERTSSATVKTRLELLEAANAYAALRPVVGPLDAGSTAAAQEWVERLAEAWRVAEEAGITHAEFAEEFSTERTHLLLGAIQDSFILLSAGEERGSEELLDVREMTDRIEELRDDGAFDDGPIKPRAFPAAGDTDAKTFDEVSFDLLDVVGDASVFFARLGREGDSLEGLESEARSLLSRVASAGRRAESSYAVLVSGDGRLGALLVLSLHRSMVAALVLRLSPDPARRRLAIPLPDLGSRISHVQEHLKQTWR